MFNHGKQLIASALAMLSQRTSVSEQLSQVLPTSDNAFGNRKGGRKSAHRFSGVAAQRRAARKARNVRKCK